MNTAVEFHLRILDKVCGSKLFFVALSAVYQRIYKEKKELCSKALNY